MFRWSLYPVGDDRYLVVAAVALLLLVELWRIKPAIHRTSKNQRLALVFLRMAIIALVTIAMLRPTLVYTTTKKQPATLVVAADRSRSMLVADEANGRTRWDAMVKTLANARGALGDLARDFEVKAYTFDAEPHSVEVKRGVIALGDTADGKQTAMGYAMDRILQQEAGKRLLGFVLLTDGAQRAYPPHDTLPQTAAANLGHLGYPLYTVRFGQSRAIGQIQDVAVVELLADPRVFVKNELNVTGQIRVSGYGNREIPVRLLAETSPGKMAVVAEQRVKATADAQLIPVRFAYVPDKPGERKLTLEVAAQPGELVVANNSLSTFVNVSSGGLRVLYIEGFPPRVEQRYLCWSLASSQDIHVEVANLNLRAPTLRPKDLAERCKPGKYDVYILGDVDSTAFSKDELTRLAESVSKGAGLLMMGGARSFGPGGYGETPLAAVIPIQIDRLERQPLDSPPSRDLHLDRPLRMVPTQDGLTHFGMMLGRTRQESESAWRALPPLDGANRFAPDRIKPGARTLAVTDRDEPLLLSQNYGEGRVVAFAGDTTWRWWMRGFESAHKRFWRQLVLWLAQKDESSESNVWIKLAQRRFPPAQRVEFSVGVNGPTGEPLKNAAFQGEIELPDGSKQPLSIVRGDRQTAGNWSDTIQPGDYTLRVTATVDGKEVGQTKSRFLVFQHDLELDNPLADATLLDNLAKMTGGESVVPEELPALIQRLAEATEQLEVQTEAKLTFWDKWPFFLFVIGLLLVEWYLRKRWGLV
jgi:hypothetical protein